MREIVRNFEPAVKAGFAAPKEGRTPKTIGKHAIVQTEKS
jgi:hypothetical protein